MLARPFGFVPNMRGGTDGRVVVRDDKFSVVPRRSIGGDGTRELARPFGFLPNMRARNRNGSDLQAGGF